MSPQFNMPIHWRMPSAMTISMGESYTSVEDSSGNAEMINLVERCQIGHSEGFGLLIEESPSKEGRNRGKLKS